MTGAQALALARRIRGLYQRQRELLSALEPDVEGAVKIASEVDLLIAELPHPASMTDVDPQCLNDLRNETNTVQDLRTATMATLAILKSQLVAENAQANKDTEAVRAYRTIGPSGANFLDQRR